MQNFVRFYAVESETELAQEFWEKRNSSPPYRDMCAKTAIIVTSNDIYFVYKFLYNFIY